LQNPSTKQIKVTFFVVYDQLYNATTVPYND